MITMAACLPNCGDDPAPTAGVTVSYVEQIQPILHQRYVRCHRGDSEQIAFLDPWADRAYQQLVLQPSVQLPHVRIVKPFGPNSSYLMWKMENDSRIEGFRMPMLSLIALCTTTHHHRFKRRKW